VRSVRALRESGVCEYAPSIRGCLMIAKTLQVKNQGADARDNGFRQVCLEILASAASREGSKAEALKVREVVNRLIDEHC